MKPFVKVAICLLVVENGPLEGLLELQAECGEVVGIGHSAQLVVIQPGDLELLEDQAVSLIQVEPEVLVEVLGDVAQPIQADKARHRDRQAPQLLHGLRLR